MNLLNLLSKKNPKQSPKLRPKIEMTTTPRRKHIMSHKAVPCIFKRITQTERKPQKFPSMESSESVDDTFRARVEKVFGSLASSKSSTMKSSPWSLTDDEVERREWRRDTDTRDRDDTPCSASFDECFKKDQRASRRKLRRELDDPNDDGEEQADLSFSDEWEIRSSIGLDSTLDHEVLVLFCVIYLSVLFLFLVGIA